MIIDLQMFAAMEPKVTIKQYPKAPNVRTISNYYKVMMISWIVFKIMFSV